MTEDEMVGWAHQLNGHEFEQTPGDSEGQGSLACCSPWACKELDITEHVCTCAQRCVTLCTPLGSRPPGCSVHGIRQARTLEWVAISSSRGSSQTKDGSCVSCISCTASGLFFSTAASSGKPSEDRILPHPQNAGHLEPCGRRERM